MKAKGDIFGSLLKVLAHGMPGRCE